jgi:hypothetical protein
VSTLLLYAIVARPTKRSLGVGLSRKELEVVRAGGVYVVVERRGAPRATARSLRAYDRIVRRIAGATGAALPFRFASAVEEGSLARLLDPARDTIARALDLVRDCVQYTLRVYGDPAPPPEVDDRQGPGTKWLAARLAARRVPEIAPVATATKDLVRAIRVERHDRAPLLASVYHLVPRADAPAYEARVDASRRELARVRIEKTGPWPPYAFAELT